MSARTPSRLPETFGELCSPSRTRASGPTCLLNAHGLLAAYRHRRQPVVLVRLLASDDGEELLLNSLGDGADGALADADLVHRTNRRNLRRGTGEEGLVRDVEQFARNALFSDRNSQSRAICSTESRVMPGSTELPSGAVCSTPLRTMKTFSPEPSLT